jgi:hypothetical protein
MTLIEKHWMRGKISEVLRFSSSICTLEATASFFYNIAILVLQTKVLKSHTLHFSCINLQNLRNFEPKVAIMSQRACNIKIQPMEQEVNLISFVT